MMFCPYCKARILDESIPICCGCGRDISGELTETEIEMNDGYDGYYDDLDPIDKGEQRGELDKILIRNVILVIGIVVLIILVCVIALLFL